MNGKRIETKKSNVRKSNADENNIVKAKKRRRRKSAFGRVAVLLTVLLAVAVGVVLSLTVFFKIKSIDVYGDCDYQSDEIIKAGKINLDDNLIRLDAESVSQHICSTLPYVENVTVKKKLPSIAELYITPAVQAGYLKNGSEYIILSTSGKVLEKVADKPENLTEIAGLDGSDAEISHKLKEQDDAVKCMSNIYYALGKGVFAEVTLLDVSDQMSISFTYRDRITVKLGSKLNLSEKIKFVENILLDSEKVNPDDVGIIYAENAKKISYLRKGSYEEKVESAEETDESETVNSQSKSTENNEQEKT